VPDGRGEIGGVGAFQTHAPRSRKVSTVLSELARIDKVARSG
jgi:hypothetical protein